VVIVCGNRKIGRTEATWDECPIIKVSHYTYASSSRPNLRGYCRSMKHIIYVILVLAATYGCSPTAQMPSEVSDKAVTDENTVGSATELTGFLSLRVDGFGVVINLAGTGSRECPPAQREFIIKYLRGMKSRRELKKPYDQMTAEQILDSTSTAVVQVSGLVPAGAPKGEAFDVEVRALPQTQTTSLQGGLLLPSDMRILAVGSRGILAGQRGAVASGELFINPFPTSSREARKSRGTYAL